MTVLRQIWCECGLDTLNVTAAQWHSQTLMFTNIEWRAHESPSYRGVRGHALRKNFEFLGLGNTISRFLTQVFKLICLAEIRFSQ